MEAYLPQTVLYRNKMGFAVPLASWFRGPLRERVRAGLLGNTLADTGIFNMAFIEKCLISINPDAVISVHRYGHC